MIESQHQQQFRCPHRCLRRFTLESFYILPILFSQNQSVSIAPICTPSFHELFLKMSSALLVRFLLQQNIECQPCKLAAGLNTHMNVNLSSQLKAVSQMHRKNRHEEMKDLGIKSALTSIPSTNVFLFLCCFILRFHLVRAIAM